MKSLAIAIGIALSICLSLFFVFHAFGVGDKVAAPLASSALSLITFIHDKVDKALSAGASRVTPGIVPVSQFDIRWPYMLVYAILTLIGIFEITSLVYSFPAMMFAGHNSDPKEEFVSFMAMVTMISLPIIAWSIFVLGRWMGIRSARAAYWLLPVGILVSRTLEMSVLYMIAPEFRPVLKDMATPSGMLGVGGTLTLVLIVGWLGVWRGNKVRFGAYFNSLLKQVPEKTRGTLLDLTYGEALAAAATRHAPPPPLNASNASLLQGSRSPGD